MLVNYPTNPKLCLQRMRQRTPHPPSPRETRAFIKLTWLPRSRRSPYPRRSSPGLICSSHLLLFIWSLSLSLHSARIITNDNSIVRPDTSLFSILSSSTLVRLSFSALCRSSFSVSLSVGTNGDGESDCPGLGRGGERRVDQHGTNCFPPSPVERVRYAFIIKVYLSGGGEMTLSNELLVASSVRLQGPNAHVPETIIKLKAHLFSFQDLHPPTPITAWLGGPLPWQLTV